MFVQEPLGKSALKHMRTCCHVAKRVAPPDPNQSSNKRVAKPPCKNKFCVIAMLNIWFEFCAPLRYRFFLSWNINLRGKKTWKTTHSVPKITGRWHAYIYIYMHMRCCAQFRGAFCQWVQECAVFFARMEQIKMTKNVFPPVKGKQFSAQVHRNVHSGANIECVQKRGAYVAQHKHPIIEQVHAGRS